MQTRRNPLEGVEEEECLMPHIKHLIINLSKSFSSSSYPEIEQRDQEEEEMVLLGMGTTLLLSLVLALYYAYYMLWLKPERRRHAMRKQGIRGPRPSFMVGNIPEMKTIQGEEKARRGGQPLPLASDYNPILFPYFDRWRKEYGPNFVYSTGGIQLLYLTSPELVKEIGIWKSLDLGKPSYLQKDRGPLFGQGILAANGEVWARQRKVIAPQFYLDKIKGMVELMVEAALPLLESWDRRIEEGGGSANLLVSEDLRKYSADVISRACFGSCYLKGEEIFSRIRQLQTTMSRKSIFVGIPGQRFLPTNRNRELWRLTREVHSLIMGIVEEHNRNFSSSPQCELLESIIEGAGLSGAKREDFIVDNCKNIYFAGHETTAVSAAWCLLLLASYPEWQHRVRAEIQEISRGKLPDFEMIRQLKTVTMVIQETLRLYPPGPFVSREAFNNVRLGDISIPKGMNIWVPISTFHRNPEYWGSDSNEFKPERFANGIASACKLPHIYFPFGLGSRSCAGQNFAMLELKVILFLLLSKFCFDPSPEYVHSPAFALTIAPEFGIPLVVRSESASI